MKVTQGFILDADLEQAVMPIILPPSGVGSCSPGTLAIPTEIDSDAIQCEENITLPPFCHNKQSVCVCGGGGG